MRFSSPPCAVALGLGLAVACTNEIDTHSPFDPTTSDGTSGATSVGDPTGVGTTVGMDATDGGSETTNDSAGARCGDAVISGNEECDCGGIACTGSGLDHKTCADVSDPNIRGVLTGGTLACNAASCRFDTSACTYCGDGELNGIEQCEGDEIGTSCMDLGEGTTGELTCDETTCMVDTSACTDCGYSFDFTDCNGWTTGTTAGSAQSWACGDPIGGPPNNPTGVWATNPSGDYASSESSFVQSPALDLSACAGESMTMIVTHWHDFEGGISNADGGIVQISTDGTHWTKITPTGGSRYGVANDTIDAAFPPVANTVGFDGHTDDNTMDMLQSEFDLTPYTGRSEVYIRFVFGSDHTNQFAGWYIDGLEVLGSND